MAAYVHIQGTMPGGAELAIAAMDEYSRAEIGRKTYRFVRRCMQDPELRAKIKARAAQLRQERNTVQGQPD